MIRRQKTTIFTDAKESSTVYELKKIIEGITKRSPEDQQLFKDGEILENTKTLGDCGLSANVAKAQAPASLGLSFRVNGKIVNTSLISVFAKVYRCKVHVINVYPFVDTN